MKLNSIIFRGLIPLTFLASSLTSQYWTVDSEVRNEIRKAKLQNQLPAIMKEYGISLWLTMNRDPNDDPDNIFWDRYKRLDPVSEMIGAENTFYPAIFIFTDRGERIAFVEDGDLPYIEATGIYTTIDHYKYARQTGIEPMMKFLRAEVSRINPSKIGINMSETEPVADGLTAGLRKVLETVLGKEFADRLVSAEDIIVTLWGQKLSRELENVRRSAQIANDLMMDAFKNVKPGKTTAKDIFDFIRARMKANGWEVGWDQKTCPIVRIKPSGDLLQDKIVAVPGSIISLNAGVLTKGYSNDLDRTAYILREKESKPPDEILAMWSTLRRAVEAVVESMKRGALGVDVDRKSRDIIKSAGYEEYWYQTGHPVGVWVHDIGTFIGPRHPHYGRKVELRLHEGEVFAIEPGVSIFSKELNGQIGLHLQEMVVVTRKGGEYLIPPQKEIFLIK